MGANIPNSRPLPPKWLVKHKGTHNSVSLYYPLPWISDLQPSVNSALTKFHIPRRQSTFHLGVLEHFLGRPPPFERLAQDLPFHRPRINWNPKCWVETIIAPIGHCIRLSIPFSGRPFD